jgi:hypothetical protein
MGGTMPVHRLVRPWNDACHVLTANLFGLLSDRKRK